MRDRWASWQAWCAAQQRKYERSRARWRRDHPQADVRALEEKYGVQAKLLSVEKLMAPALLLGDAPAAEHHVAEDQRGEQEEAPGDALGVRGGPSGEEPENEADHEGDAEEDGDH
jgi:hypothetical protein